MCERLLGQFPWLLGLSLNHVLKPASHAVRCAAQTQIMALPAQRICAQRSRARGRRNISPERSVATCSLIRGRSRKARLDRTVGTHEGQARTPCNAGRADDSRTGGLSRASPARLGCVRVANAKLPDWRPTPRPGSFSLPTSIPAPVGGAVRAWQIDGQDGLQGVQPSTMDIVLQEVGDTGCGNRRTRSWVMKTPGRGR